tara:strand:- start:5872 stop:6483 length:612 start_codon:yes stop_codon:yes gene_type:complete
MDIIIVAIYSYLCGSIPFALVLTKVFIKSDIRKIGSGNIGATNVLRTGNKFLAAITLFLDVTKGYLPVIITIEFFPNLILLSCLFAFLGHLFPFWLKFKGGKGVATYLGILFALSLQLSLVFMFTWLVVSLIFKYSSVSSMFASLTVLVVNFIRGTAVSIDSTLMVNQIVDTKLLFIFFILIIFTHKKNILNLKNKTEQKIKI